MSKVRDFIKIVVPILILLFGVGIIGQMDLNVKTYENYAQNPIYHKTTGKIGKAAPRQSKWEPYVYSVLYIDGMDVKECEYESWGNEVQGAKIEFYRYMNTETEKEEYVFSPSKEVINFWNAVGYTMIVLAAVVELRVFGVFSKVRTVEDANVPTPKIKDEEPSIFDK